MKITGYFLEKGINEYEFKVIFSYKGEEEKEKVVDEIVKILKKEIWVEEEKDGE